MPDTTSAWYGSMPRSARASFSACRMAKSPQPAHHVMSVVASNSLGSSRVTTDYLLAQPGHDLLRREGPAVVLVQRSVHLDPCRHPQQFGQLGRVVLLDRHRAPALAQRRGGNLFRQRPQIPELENVGATAGVVDLVSGLLTRPKRGAPAYERGFRLRRPIPLGRAHLPLRLLQLAHSLLHHATAALDLFQEMPLLVVLVADSGIDGGGMLPGQRPRRDSRLRELETLVAVREPAQLLRGQR